MQTTQNFWKKCSSCKKEIGFKTKYYVCSVSTCNGERTGYVFCSIPCFEVHLPGAKHRDAGAVEKTSPAAAGAEGVSSSGSAGQDAAPVRRIIPAGQSAGSSSVANSSATNASKATATLKPVARSSMENEVLVVVSKMKQYIRDVSGMNTSEDVNQVISHMIRLQLDRAIENARREGRKTVMARDFKI